MAGKRLTTEQIIGLLREAEVRLGQGQAIGTICRGLNISKLSYNRWRRDYGGGLKLDQAKRLEDLDLAELLLTMYATGSGASRNLTSAVISCGF